MKLKRAIEISQEDLERMNPEIDPDERNALKLLIEAGKAIPRYRRIVYPDQRFLLPGETKD